MDKIDEIFKIPNTDENEYKRQVIIEAYKIAKNIPQQRGVNVFDVKKWAESTLFEDKGVY